MIQSSGLSVTLAGGNCSGVAASHGVVTRVWRKRQKPNCAHSRRHLSSSSVAAELFKRCTNFINLCALAANLYTRVYERFDPWYVYHAASMRFRPSGLAKVLPRGGPVSE